MAKLASGVVKTVAGGFGIKEPKIEKPAPAPAPTPATKVEPAPTPAAEAPEGFKTADRMEADENIARRKRKTARNSLRIDTNVSGNSGAAGQGLNIPR